MTHSIGAPTTAAAVAAMGDYAQELGSWIKANREALGLNYGQLAAQLNVSGQSVRNWEEGVNKISAFHANCLQLVFWVEWVTFARRNILTAAQQSTRNAPMPKPRGYAAEAVAVESSTAEGAATT